MVGEIGEGGKITIRKFMNSFPDSPILQICLFD